MRMRDYVESLASTKGSADLLLWAAYMHMQAVLLRIGDDPIVIAPGVHS